MKVGLLIGCCITVLIFNVQAQLLDTLTYSWQQPRKPFFALDFSKSFGGKFGADVFGFRGGVVQNKRLYYGLGYYRINSDRVTDIQTVTESGNDTLIPGKLKYRFVSANLEYVFFKTEKFQTSIPANIGFGYSFYEYFKQRGVAQKTTKNHAAIFTMGIAAHYKIVSWIGIGAGTSFASTLGTNPEHQQNFNTLTYNLGVKIFFDDLVAAIKNYKHQQNENTDDDKPQPDFK
ncbi:MAG: hypothetical protein JNK61_02630 [Bacteroidia bacterium]|nr:hypothetical protein [Bacteroidia bacterium]HQV00992.1 hypothetical protein [Bacteroidia bacterium]